MPVWTHGETVRGYKLDQFADAFARVLGVRSIRSVRSGSSSQAAPNAPNGPNGLPTGENGRGAFDQQPDLPPDAPEWERAWHARRAVTQQRVGESL
jgi:hypothetical protein